MKYNEQTMKRECYCFTCKKYFMTCEVMPMCPNCKEKLITIVCSSTGERITGEKSER